MLAYDYPLLGLFWSIAFVFLWMGWIVLLFRVIADIFRNPKSGGAAKTVWLLFVVVIPWLGALVYVLAHGDDMAARSADQAREQDAAMRSYIADAAGTTSTADELSKLQDLRTQNVITDAEFEQQKARLLAT